MTKAYDADLTLPSVVAALPGNDNGQALVLTLIFHPCTARIGERAVIDRQKTNDWTLGRLGPLFSRGEGAQQMPLEDRHVSRRALEFSWSGDSLAVARPDDSSRCRVSGRELQDDVILDREQLRSGVPLMLSHTVVLLLRLMDGVPLAVAPDNLGMCGNSAYMHSLRQQVTQAAANDVDVLIRGETGTGKELVARALHDVGPRSDGPLVSVNMAAIPAELAAAALFGAARGAFTGSDRATTGYFRDAQGGSLFLDEVGDTPAEVQPQLLRALQQREVQSVGGRMYSVDVRVISATDAVLEGQGCDFKAALRHRLGAAEIPLLPLREHPEDIGELALLMFNSAAGAGKASALLPAEHSGERQIAAWCELFHRLLCYPWPGNVRELENFCRQIMVASEQCLTIPRHIQASLQPARSKPVTGVASRKLRSVVEAEFAQAWEDSGFEVTATARLLGVSRPSVYRRVENSREYRLADQVPMAELRSALAACGADAGVAAGVLRVSAAGLRTVLRHTDLEWH
jgi:two-component system nitrogen regulation response regulator GlnG